MVCEGGLTAPSLRLGESGSPPCAKQAREHCRLTSRLKKGEKQKKSQGCRDYRARFPRSTQLRGCQCWGARIVRGQLDILIAELWNCHFAVS